MKFINSDNYQITKAKDMSAIELANWYAFCNAIKFIAIYSKKKHINPDLIELDSREMSRYVDKVSGDILTNLKERKGIPMKYSLDMHQEDAQNMEEVAYTL